MGSRAAVFCHNGLGDGVISLVLSNNLHLNGWHVDTYQNFIGSMQNWFPHLPVISYPPIHEIERILYQYDWFFVFHNDTSEFIQKLIAEGKRRFPDSVKVIYAYPSRRIVHEPYYQDSQIDPGESMAESLRIFCEKILLLSKSTRSNGFIPPTELCHRTNITRVAIHPTSSRATKNWPKEKFVELTSHLLKRGYDPVWIIGPKERTEWISIKGDFDMPEFSTLDALARFIYESAYLVGNDSGLGHLASFLEIPTLTITRRKALARLWAPSYTTGVIVTPPAWIPNIRGFRLRDRYWQKWISIKKVLRSFDRLVKLAQGQNFQVAHTSSLKKPHFPI
jgi:heptosyltransferase III